jgi:hypothetical protein
MENTVAWIEFTLFAIIVAYNTFFFMIWGKEYYITIAKQYPNNKIVKCIDGIFNKGKISAAAVEEIQPEKRAKKKKKKKHHEKKEDNLTTEFQKVPENDLSIDRDNFLEKTPKQEDDCSDRGSNSKLLEDSSNKLRYSETKSVERISPVEEDKLRVLSISPNSMKPEDKEKEP